MDGAGGGGLYSRHSRHPDLVRLLGTERERGFTMDFIMRPNELRQRFQASNMQDLIQLEQAFDLLPELVDEVKQEVKKEVEGKGEGEFTAKDEFDILFRFYPKFYKPEDAPGWNAVMHFKIEEIGNYTLTVSDKTATTASGLEGEPTCVVETDATVLLALLFRERVQEAANEDADEELSDAQLEAVAGGKGSACGAEACGGDACGGAACGAAAGGGSACGGAACGADACGGAACGAAGCGAAACGGDACGAAACGGAACGAAACGGAACGADACGGAACGGAACGAAAGGIGGCGADACGAAACGIVLTGADACAADACGVDVIPVIPGI